MGKYCEICHKGTMSGNNVSHSNRKTRRTFKANVQKVSYVENGKEVKKTLGAMPKDELADFFGLY